jgi:peptidoglycan/xylan/chitin deacetylase (PgdA/CDA1 family)
MYHDVRTGDPVQDVPGSAAAYHISGGVFSDHLAAIKESGLTVVRASAGPEAAAHDCVVITFDDGWLGAFETAVPALRDHRFEATFYVTRDFVGRSGFATESAIIEAANAGMEIGVHGTTHRMLASCTRAEIRDELRACKDYLESLVQREVHAASVPGGDWNETVAACADEVGLTTLSTSRPGINTTRTSPFELRRISVRASTAAEDVARYCRFDVRKEMVRWAVLQGPRKLLGMQRYSRLRRRLLGERPGEGTLFEP